MAKRLTSTKPPSRSRAKPVEQPHHLQRLPLRPRTVSISGPSLRFLIDNARMALASWSCESNCFANNPQPDLSEGLGTLEIKPETIRFVVCATSDLLEDASFDVEAWLYRKISEGMCATINAAVLLGDGVGKPMGIMNPNSGIPVCEVSPATAPGQFTIQDLLMLKYEIPLQWMDGCSYLMNQNIRVAAKHELG